VPQDPEQQATDTNQTPGRRLVWWPRLILLAAVAAAVVAYYASGLNGRFSVAELRQLFDDYRARVAENPWSSVLIYFAIYVCVAAFSLPIAVWLSLLAGALFGRWLGTGVVIVAATAGATLAFVASRYLFRGLVQRRFGHRLAVINAGIERDGAYYLFTLRLIPAVPFWLINLGMGLTPMRVGTFAGVSFVGMLPGTFLYVNAGTELARINSPRDVLSLPVVASLALLGILPLILRKLLSHRKPSGAKAETRVPRH
jgi:uncharacterized membrane protein YdjX (TVP38/TMEM64 family)